MKKIPAVVLFSMFAFAVLSCSLAGKFIDSGGPDMARASELWSDVPRMDGLAQSDLELPFAIKLILRTVLNNLWRLNKEGEDKTPASGDWIVFTLNGSPTDVQNFYTNSRMTSFGNWQPGKEKTCLDGKDNGFNGVMCVFQKIADQKEIVLAIIAVKDDKSKQTNVFYLRLEQDAKNSPGNSSTTPRTAARPPAIKGPITKLNGPAPYGIERRPMPGGADLDQLLPEQVGPFSRAILEKSEQRGTTPTSVQIDGNSVYATYRNGNKEIFVEFSIASSAENAQAGWDVVAGDANGGVIPSDPKLASIGTEPSYLEVIDDNGAYMAWTRGGYFFSANAKGGEADLDAFMNAFPY